MPGWQTASLMFFAYVAVVALLRPRRPGVAGRLLGGILCGVALAIAASLTSPVSPFVVWFAPALVLLIAYWSSGLLFVAPVPRQERMLRWLDDRLAIRQVARRTPRLIAEILEAAYVGVYLLIPLALLLHLTYAPAPDPSRFWSVVLVTDFICFAILPWIQTRPPRALEGGEPWTSSIRGFNLRLVDATSIQANTFPSGHAAEALVAALLVVAAPLPLVALIGLAAVAVAAGAVLGRYHYLADAIAGWMVAVAVVLWSGR